MVTIIKGDMFDSNATHLCHQVNCQGVMGSGVAKQVKARYPKAFDEYVDCLKQWVRVLPTEPPIGVSQFVDCDDVTIVNMFGQDTYGYNGKQHTNYEALRTCFNTTAKHTTKDDAIAFPYRIGCDRGGGDLEVVYKMIEEEFADRVVEIYDISGASEN